MKSRKQRLITKKCTENACKFKIDFILECHSNETFLKSRFLL